MKLDSDYSWSVVDIIFHLLSFVDRSRLCILSIRTCDAMHVSLNHVTNHTGAPTMS